MATEGPYSKLPIWLIERTASLTPKAVRMILALRKYANFETLTAWPSVRTIRRDFGLAYSSIAAATKELEAAGLIQVSQGSRRASNVYLLAQHLDQARLWKADYANRKEVVDRGDDPPRTPIKPAEPGLFSTWCENDTSWCENDTSWYENGTRMVRAHTLDDPSAPIIGAMSAPPRGAHHYQDNHYQKNYLQIKSPDELSEEENPWNRAERLLKNIGIRGDIPAALLTEHEPEAIFQAVDNALARRDLISCPDRRRAFNIPGYVINSLNQARIEGHAIPPSRQVKRSRRNHHQIKADKERHHQRIQDQIKLLKGG